VEDLSNGLIQTVALEELNNIFLDDKAYYEKKYNIVLYDNQLKILNAIGNPLNHKIAIGMSRGGGKSWSVALAIIEMCLKIPEIKIAIAAPKLGQSKRLITEMYSIIGKATKEVANSIESTSSSMIINFKNGSKCFSMSAAKEAQSEGEHPNCFDGESTIIRTDKGKKKIKDIVENKLNVNVQSYNEESGKVEYKPITDWHKNKKIENKKMLKISYEICNKIQTITCTEDHLIYTKNRGWVKAIDLNLENDIVISSTAAYTISNNKNTSHEEYLSRGEKSKTTQIKNCELGLTVSWSKGQTKETNKSIKMRSEKLMGHKVSEKTMEISRAWGKKMGGMNKGKHYKLAPRVTEVTKCQNCNRDIIYTGTPKQIEQIKKLKVNINICSICAHQIGAEKTAKTRQANGSYDIIQFNFKCFKKGFQEDLGHYTRSSWETNYCRILKYENKKHEYEPQAFKIIYPNGDTHRYTPDIKISDTEWIEIKGQFNDEDVLKMKLFREQYPDNKIIIVGAKKRYKELVDVDYKTLINQYKNLIELV
jgi:hypothetical protein